VNWSAASARRRPCSVSAPPIVHSQLGVLHRSGRLCVRDLPVHACDLHLEQADPLPQLLGPDLAALLQVPADDAHDTPSSDRGHEGHARLPTERQRAFCPGCQHAEWHPLRDYRVAITPDCALATAHSRRPSRETPAHASGTW
jgi:hypothetical protein